ncbi:MAG TPA: VCBS repeat-containing protein, partial [Chitinophagaceae bacterium]|nr:VCBS repeat-containing protein [Chitinophagaceae bacterium]
YFKHTSFNSMGQDIIDMNNDGLVDVFELDMSPEDNYRKKMMLNANSYVTFQNFEWYGYQYQYIRNTLQLNLGPRILSNDTIGPPAFGDISFMSGVAQTDWSWTPLITDFNNDGFRDIIVTNGFPKDVTDHDFIAYRQQAQAYASKAELIERIPEVKLHNYAFLNNGDLTFRDATADWGLQTPSFSNGAAYADLDNDGDMDMVVNNINDKAFVYRNTTRSKDAGAHHYLTVAFEGYERNRNGIGATVSVHYKGRQQVYENTPYRGYLSSNQNVAHFGLGTVTVLDSVVVKWNNTLIQVLYQVKADQLLNVKMADAREKAADSSSLLYAHSLFREVSKALDIDYKHFDHDFIDFNIQTTLPHKLSEYSPALAAGDINSDGLDDLVMGGNSNYPAQVFFQTAKGGFVRKPLLNSEVGNRNYSDAGLLLLDVNGDGSLDLYSASGGYRDPAGSPGYGDHLYLNDGKGNLTPVTDALPPNFTSKLCVRAFDYNRDGKLDLFVSGRVEPHRYPKPVSSFIYRNDSEDGKAKFTDVTGEVAPDLKNIGLVCDALFSDFDNDGAPDLILAGEWMPVTFLKNTNGIFRNVTAASGIAGTSGWWNSITAGDFRHTGRTDYIIGNVGLNSLYKASDEFPVFITANDFDRNGGYEAIPSLYLPDAEGRMKEFPAHGRDDVIDKMPVLKKKFNNYKSFAVSTMDQIFTGEQMKGALRLKVNNSQSCFVRNDGNGRFTLIPLPPMAQISLLNSMIAEDFDADGHLDVLVNGNDFGTEVSVGRYDALNGLLLKGDGKGGFAPLSILQSGIYIPGNGKALVKLRGASGHYLVAASQHRDALKVFQLKKKKAFLPVAANDQFAMIRLADGSVRKEEFYHGASFLSQSPRFITLTDLVKSVEITDNRGQKRTISF